MEISNLGHDEAEREDNRQIVSVGSTAQVFFIRYLEKEKEKKGKNMERKEGGGGGNIQSKLNHKPPA